MHTRSFNLSDSLMICAQLTITHRLYDPDLSMTPSLIPEGGVGPASRHVTSINTTDAHPRDVTCSMTAVESGMQCVQLCSLLNY